ncbi:MAG: 50S ribosomal protein L13 [Candidatus Margulisiibacteriota bacterium]|jgi:large subunit ribosomal protein L13
MKIKKTYQPVAKEIVKKWWIINAEGQTLGRLATKIAQILRGRDKAVYAPNVDTGDFVIVTNASKIHVTGKKLQDKFYYNYSGYPGGLKKVSLENLLKKYPDRVIREAVKGMLPKNKMQQPFLNKLKIYADEKHGHEAQKPEVKVI